MTTTSRTSLRAAFVVFVGAAAAVKAAQLRWWSGQADLPVQDVVRQVVVLAPAFVLLSSARRASPVPPTDTGPGAPQLADALGLTLPTHDPVRLGLGVTSIAALGAGCLSTTDGGLRWVLVGTGGALLGTLVVGELRRPRGTSPGTPRPDRAWLWAVVPVGVAAGGTAITLGVKGVPGELTPILLANLVLVTAFGEELLFRGVLLATAYRLFPRLWAEVLVAVGFGLWHVGNGLQEARGDPSGDLVKAVAIAVGGPTLGGVLFSFLRHRSRSLTGSVSGHVATNLPGIALKEWLAKGVAVAAAVKP